MACTTTALLDLLDWDALPADVRAAISELGPYLLDERPAAEVALLAGTTETAAKRRIALIRAAILAQAFARIDELEPSIRALVLHLAQ